MGRKLEKPKAHKKEKQPKKHKEKKSGIRQKQKQNQVVNIHIDNNSDGDSGKKKKMKQIKDLATSVFNPSLITPHYGINDRQPVNPLNPDIADVNDLTNLIISGISGLTQATQPQSTQSAQTQSTQPQPTPPIKVPVTQTTPTPTPTPPSQVVAPEPAPKPKTPVITKPPPIKIPITPAAPKPYEPAKSIDIEKIIEDVKKNAEKHKHKEENKLKPHDVQSVTVDPIPQDKPKEPVKEIVTDVMGFDPKYDGLKMKHRTMPFSEVLKGTAQGLVDAGALISMGTNPIAHVLGNVGAVAGYAIGGDNGATLGTYAGSLAAHSISNATGLNGPNMSGYFQRMPREPRQQRQGNRKTAFQKTTLGRLKTAAWDPLYQNLFPPEAQPSVKENVRNSQLLKNLEAEMAARPQSAPVGESTSLLQTSGSRSRTRVQAPSLMTSISDSIKSTVRRLSGGRERAGKIGKGTYAAIPTEEDFQYTLKKAKANTKGTYSILPPEDDLSANLKNKTKLNAKPKSLGKIANESEPLTKEWSAMKRAKEANERNIRKSIEALDKASTRPANTPKQETSDMIRLIVEPDTTREPLAPTRTEFSTPKKLNFSEDEIKNISATKIQRQMKKSLIPSTEQKRVRSNFETLSSKKLKNDRALDLEVQYIPFAIRRHTKDNYSDLANSFKKNRKESNFKAALAMHELDKRSIQPHNYDLENELSRMMQPKQKLKSSELSKLNMSTINMLKTPRVQNPQDSAAVKLQKVIRGHSGRTKAITQLESKVGRLENELQSTKVKANEVLGDRFRQDKQKLEKKISHNKERKNLTPTQAEIVRQGIKQYSEVIIPKKTGPKPKNK